MLLSRALSSMHMHVLTHHTCACAHKTQPHTCHACASGVSNSLTTMTGTVQACEEIPRALAVGRIMLPCTCQRHACHVISCHATATPLETRRLDMPARPPPKLHSLQGSWQRLRSAAQKCTSREGSSRCLNMPRGCRRSPQKRLGAAPRARAGCGSPCAPAGSRRASAAWPAHCCSGAGGP